jgi:hypothetical protein
MTGRAFVQALLDSRAGKGSHAMKLRSCDGAPSAVLAEHCRVQAELCRQMTRMTMSRFKEGWLELAAEWKKLVRETESKQH